MFGDAGGYMGVETLGFGAVAPVQGATEIAAADVVFATTAAAE